MIQSVILVINIMIIRKGIFTMKKKLVKHLVSNDNYIY